jgi:nucleoside 2-deoxyribosyltransferase
MRSCAGLIANLTPFRGVSVDSGTAYEVGFMRALGRPVFGYSNLQATYVERSRAYRAQQRGQPDADAPDVEIEDFDGTENLMIEIAIHASGGRIVRRAVARGQEMRDLTGFEACLLQARDHSGFDT